MSAEPRPNLAAYLLRTITCFAALYQIRILSGELADTPFFCVALVLASSLGFLFSATKVRALPSLVAIALIPWLIRAVIASRAANLLPAAVLNDSRLLRFDQNLFIAILPFVWAGWSAYFSAYSRRFIRWEQLADIAFMLCLFLFKPSKYLPMYERPIFLVAFFSAFALFQLFVLLCADADKRDFSRIERSGSIALLIVISGFAAVFLLRPFEERSIDSGGGLLQPNLTRFDFSQILRLESEISLTDDLILIARKDAEDSHVLLRRFILSGYDRKRGFYWDAEVDGAEHPERMPDTALDLSAPPNAGRRTTEQEYYLVNFDPSAFIALNRPRHIVPFNTWDAASFSSVYSVTSDTTDAFPFELMQSVSGPANPVSLRMGESEYRRYTDFGEDDRIAALALKMVGDIGEYWDRVQAIYEQLKYGEYRYSLKPGIASDGDQLGRFLFDSKKGYCSYFAFSMSLLVRSLGIPARVAVGFFIDPATKVFDYYPVRADMAHAWVEVYFPDYGWIEYDPTTENVAEGEVFRFSSGVAPELLERLMKEILENRDGLSAKETSDSVSALRSIPRVAREAAVFFRRTWMYFVAVIWLLISIASRTGPYLAAQFSSRPRRAAQLISRHALARLSYAGHRKSRGETDSAFISRIDAAFSLGASAIAEANTRARFAPSFSQEELTALHGSYRFFSRAYARRVPRLRRFLAWIAPPFVSVLPPVLPKGAPSKALILLMLLSIHQSEITYAQEFSVPSDVIYAEAEEAVNTERWDHAVDLFRKGAASYPNDPRFPLELGDLFADRGLYSLAWEQYKAAERIDSEDPSLLYRLSTTAGRLNLDAVSTGYLERVVALRPDDRDAIGDLGWMYFKLHRLRDGERFLLGAIERLGADRGFSMTLGTIYSDLYEYEKSKKQYLDAIADADANGAKTFSAVAHYNLSILEARHHRFAEALRQTDLSLAEANRASGHLARGELSAKRLDLHRAFAEYSSAYELDISPLSKINIADAYRVAGRLSEARAYAEETLSARDVSWMLNYGTNITQHRRELHEILMDTYEGLANIELTTPRGSMADAVAGLIRAGLYSIQAMSHRLLFRRYSLEAANSYDAAGQRLDALINYYNAFQAYPERALRYLDEAMKFETVRIPEAEPGYILEKGRLQSDPELLERAIADLDPIWERDLIAEAWAEYALISDKKHSAVSSAVAAEKLFALNRGALRQKGIRLPVFVEISFADAAADAGFVKSATAKIKDALRSSGFLPDRESARFRLAISVGPNNAHCELFDGGRGTTILRTEISLPTVSRRDRASFGRALAEAAFRVD